MRIDDKDRDIIILSDMISNVMVKIEFLSTPQLIELSADLSRWEDGADHAELEFIEGIRVFIDRCIDEELDG